MPERLSWSEITRSDDYRGQWVALDNCRYDRGATHPAEAHVVDTDEDLTALCNRIRERNRSHCAIVFCDEEQEPVSIREGASTRTSSPPPR
jgi:hypothetical protein